MRRKLPMKDEARTHGRPRMPRRPHKPRRNAVLGARAVLGRPIRTVHITRKKVGDESQK
jgi:hypothetical protein